MKKTAFALLILLLSLCLFSCVVPAAGDGDTTADTVADTTAKDTTAADTTEAVTTEADTTEAVTTEAVTTEAPATEAVTTEAETTAPPVLLDPVKISYNVENICGGGTFTGYKSLPCVDFTVNDPQNAKGRSLVRYPFSYGVARDGAPHSITVNNQKTFDSFGTGGLAWDNRSGEKVLYLTFDCGYKYGDLTTRILDTLKEKEVKAAFFCTMDYLRVEPAEIARMIAEGHTVGNHSVTHPDCTTISREAFARELLGVHNYMRVNFGYTPKYFRFPTGAFSENALELASSVGYRSIFWSVAYADWDPQNQQGVESAYAQVTSRLHPGAVILLHSTSPDNAAILGRVIDYAKSEGYEFRTLDEYPW